MDGDTTVLVMFLYVVVGLSCWLSILSLFYLPTVYRLLLSDKNNYMDEGSINRTITFLPIVNFLIASYVTGMLLRKRRFITGEEAVIGFSRWLHN